MYIIKNEFAMVNVFVELNKWGDRLIVRDPQTGNEISLDPLELEALTRLKHEHLAKWINHSEV